MQGCLRQLLRNFLDFCRFGVFNSSLFLYSNYTINFAFFTLKFFPLTPLETYEDLNDTPEPLPSSLIGPDMQRSGPITQCSL